MSLATYGDARTAFTFGVNARGVQRDLLISDDNQSDDTWDAVWTSAVSIDAGGWSAELRIPLSQLRFGAAEANIWGFNVTREIAREDAVYCWAPLDAESDRLVSAYATLTGVGDLRAPRNVELRPYVATGVTRSPGVQADPFYRATDPSATLGLDLTAALSPTVTFTATVNPDFGQVEADPSLVNLTAFEAFLPERRPFFVEGADLFSVDGPQLVYSRRIGRAPQGSLPPDAAFADAPAQTTIGAAAKLTGRTRRGWQFGALAAVTPPERGRFSRSDGSADDVLIEPTTVFAVGRATRTYRGGQSALGGVVTTVARPGLPDRLDALHQTAVVAGADGRHRVGDFEVSGSLYRSHVAGSTTALLRTQRLSSRYFQRPGILTTAVDSSRTGLTGWSANAQVGKVSGRWRWNAYGRVRTPGFEVNDLGFQSQVDELTPGFGVRYVASRPNRTVRALSTGVYGYSTWTFDGTRRESYVEAYGDVTLASAWTAYGGLGTSLPARSVTDLRGGPALQQDLSALVYGGVRTPSQNRWRGSMAGSVSAEPAADGVGASVRTAIGTDLSSAARASLEVAFRRGRTPAQYVATVGIDRPTYVLARLDQQTLAATLRLDVAFTTGLSLQLYAQPFTSAGRYTDYLRVADPKAPRFDDRFAPFPAMRADGTVILGAGGSRETEIGVPDFAFRQLRSTAVLRWQFRPGSALFAVWSHGQASSEADGLFDVLENTRALFRADPTDTVLLKVTYWLGS